VCGKEKKIDDFSRNKNIKGGRAHICKECERLRAKEYYKKNRDGILKRHKKWIEDNRERHNEIVYESLVRHGKIQRPGYFKNRGKNEKSNRV